MTSVHKVYGLPDNGEQRFRFKSTST